MKRPANTRAELIDRYEDGGMHLRDAIKTVTPQIAAVRTPPGVWSIHELVIHLQDTDAIAIDRMKRVVTEENPTLLNADESAYVDRLHPHAQSMDEAAMLVDISRRQWSRVLRRLPDEAFERAGTHDTAGRLTLADLLTTYTDHLEHHLKFLAGKLERLRTRRATR